MNMLTINDLANIDAEQHIIGGILLEPEMIKECILLPDHFYDTRHKNLIHVMKELDEKNIPIDIVAIMERIGTQRLDRVGGLSYITDMAGSVPTAANFSYYQSVVLEYYEKRRTYEIAQEIMRDTFEQEPGEVRTAAIEALNALDDNNADNDDGNISAGLVQLYDWMEQEHGEITGAPTGFRDLDRMLSGLQRQDLVIIGARPSMGKTAFALGIAANYSSDRTKKNPTGIFSLEMPEQGLLKRFMSNLGNIDAEHMRNPMKNFSGDDWQKSTMALGQLNEMPLHIFDKAGVDIGYIRKKCRHMKRLYPNEHILIIIDYLQLIIGNPKHGGNRTQEISEISRMLKQIARELDITIIALSQLSRNVEQRQDKRPMMSDIRESGQIEQDADVIGFLYRDDYYDKESEAQGIIEVIIAKQRNGAIGTVQLAFAKEYNKFLNIDWSNR